MKKLLLVAVVAVSLVACGETATNEEETMTDTSTVVMQDTAQVVTDTTITTDTINADK